MVRATLNQIKHKLLVMSGKGGVGKSSVAVSLALTLARQGYQVGLMDVDLHGPNVLRMLGLTQPLRPDVQQLFYVPEDMANLKVVSIEAFMPDRESAVIWRGPLKHQTIRQFISDIDWGKLDYLVIDSPPGTGDEPLSVVQTIPEAQAIIVTTPQEISLADVRKSIDFCHKTNLKILGLLENMGRLVCPDCGKEIPLFSSGGGQRLATLVNIPFLGSLPFDPQVVAKADQGQLSLLQPEDSPFLQEFTEVVKKLVTATPESAGVSAA
jgi:Mrp family chromosome partitioning ATPase